MNWYNIVLDNISLVVSWAQEMYVSVLLCLYTDRVLAQAAGGDEDSGGRPQQVAETGRDVQRLPKEARNTCFQHCSKTHPAGV